MTPIVQAFAIAAVAIGTGTATMTVMKDDPVPMVVPEADWAPSTLLDGQSFQLVGELVGSDEVLEDVIIFQNGEFQSVNCQKYCDFGWTDYKTWTEDNVIHFTVTTRCPTAPHHVVWHGQVTGEELELVGQWTTDRWYWTQQLDFVGTGTLKATTGPVTSG